MPEPTSITIIKPIPNQVVNVGATFGPISLYDYFSTTLDHIYFQAELADGRPLPKGISCTRDGVINGIPGEDTLGTYRVIVTAESDIGETLKLEFDLVIKERIAIAGDLLLKKLKAEVWEALGKNLPLPEMEEILNRPITAVEIYYLLQRFATLTIWDVYNLDSPSGLTTLQLTGMSQHYNIYDRGSCLVAAPKELFSHERTLEDALQTARAMAREVYKRGWVIEFAGFDKMVRAAWVELRLQGDKTGKYIDVVHYNPTQDDLRVYESEARTQLMNPSP